MGGGNREVDIFNLKYEYHVHFYSIVLDLINRVDKREEY